MWLPRGEWILLLSVVLFSWTTVAAANTSFLTPSKTKFKILGVFGHPGKSHFDVFLPLVEELARRGHDVTVLSHYPRSDEAKSKEPLPNYRDISLRDEKVGVFVNVVDLKLVDQSILKMFKETYNLRRMASLACETGLRNPQVKQLVQSGEKFDLILTESFNTDCFLSLVHQFKAPFMALSSHQIMPWMNNRLGNPPELSFMPNIFQGNTRPLDFVKRLFNTLSSAYMTTVFDTWYYSIDQALAEEVFGPGVPDIREISRNTTAILVNTHYSLHGAKANLPYVVEIGGLHIPAKSNPLPTDIAKFLDDAPQGVLYFNLGSMVKASSMPTDKLEVILKVISAIPRKVIWKWEADELPYKPENLLVRKWLPQFDVLRHPNVKCYLGHGGLLGLSEGVYNGVPMVLVPLYGDQFHNAAAAETRGAAVVVKYTELDERSLRHALDEVFNNTRYRENARKLSKAYRDRPASPLETAVWWTEYVARGNGLPYLKCEGANLPWYQRNLLDVALFLLVLSLALLYSTYRAVRFLLSLLFAVPPETKGGRTRTPRSKKTN